MQVCIAPQATLVEPRPSPSQVRTALPSQVRAPGAQAHPAHIPVRASQLFIEGQAIGAAYPRPSSLQRREALAPAQLTEPGAQSCSTHSPARQLWPAAHGDAVYPRPSASQTSRAVKLLAGQRDEPGAQTRSTHAPPRQLWLDPQGMASYPLPRVLQTSRTPPVVQRAAPGVQARGRQRSSAPQNSVPGAQSLSPAHSTQIIRVTLHTSPRSLHWRDEEQLRGRATQAASRHCWSAGQSPSAPQSTQSPSVGWQTCDGHCRDVVHAVPATQRFVAQTSVAPAQSARVRQSTHTPRSRSHT